MPTPSAMQASSTTPQGSGTLASLLQPTETPMAGATRRIVAKPTAKFFLAIPPDPWEPAVVDGESVWLPKIKHRRAVPGCDNFRMLRKADIEKGDLKKAYQNALDIDSEKGWTWLDPEMVIPAEFLPDGVPQGKACREIACLHPKRKTPGTMHTEPWNIPVRTPRGQVQRFRFDHGAYNRFRLWVAQAFRDRIGTPTEFSREEHLETARRRLGRNEGLQWATESIREREVAKAQAAVEAIPPIPEDIEEQARPSQLATPSKAPSKKAARKPRSRKAAPSTSETPDAA